MMSKVIFEERVDESQLTKCQIIKNLFVLSFAFLLLCSSADGLQMLQSTLNRDYGIGVISISVQFAFGCITALFFLKYFIVKFGSKRIIMFCIITHIPSTAANLYPQWISMIPAYIILGISSTLMWGSNSAYLYDLSKLYSKQDEVNCKFKKSAKRINENFYWSNNGNCQFVEMRNKGDVTKPIYSSKCNVIRNMQPTKHHIEPNALNTIYQTANVADDSDNNKTNNFDSLPSSDNQEHLTSAISINVQTKTLFVSKLESTTARFFGFHSMLYQSDHIWSNLVSFFVLQSGVLDNTFSRDPSCNCGADFCNVESNCFESNLKEPNEKLKFMLISIFLALNVSSALLVAFFLEPMNKRNDSARYNMEYMSATLKQFIKPKQLLLVPLSMYMGMMQGFFYADFPKAFVGCAWGMHHVGLVMIFYGIICSLMSTLSGWMIKHLGRRTIFLAAETVNIAVNVLGLVWHPDSNQPFMFFLAAGMWGFVMASFWSQLKAFYGVLFKSNEEAAFSCYELIHSIGACLSFAYSNQLCIFVKVYIMLTVSTIGMIGYLIVENEQIR